MSYKQKRLEEFDEKFRDVHFATGEPVDIITCDVKASDIKNFISDTIDEVESKQLQPIDEGELHKMICGDVPWSIDDCEQANKIVKAISSKFGTKKELYKQLSQRSE